jgi:O-antigen ligase
MWSQEVWDEYLEKAISALILCGIAVEAFFFGGVHNPEFAGFAGLAFMLWLVRLWVNPSHRFFLHPMLWPMVAFWGYGLWRAGRCTVPHYAELECLQVTAVFFAFVVTLHNLHKQETTLWVTHVLAATGCLVAGYAIIQLLRQSDSILWMRQPIAYAKRAGGTFVNPNHLAGFLAPLIPLSLARMFLSREAAMVKVLHGYATLMMVGGVAVTMSRGGWVANAAGLGLLLVWLAFRRRNLRIPVAILVFTALCGASVFFMVNDKAHARLVDAAKGTSIDSGLSRPWLWSIAFRMWCDHPWEGVGPGQFDVEFPPYRTKEIQPHPGWVHNDYLNLLVDYGALGAILAALVLGIFVWGAFRTAKYAQRAGNDLGYKNSNRTAFFFGATAGLAGLGVHFLLDFDAHIPAIALLCAVLSALAASNLRFATERFWVTPQLWSRITVTAAGVGALAWFCPALANASLERYYLNKAEAAVRVDEALIAALESAHRVAPGNPRTVYELGENFRRASFEGEGNWRALALAAEQWLTNAVALNPRDPEARLSLARTRQWLAETNQADADFQLALKLGPNSVEIANHVAWHLMSVGKTNEALALFGESLSWNWWSNPMAQHFKAQLQEQPK